MLLLLQPWPDLFLQQATALCSEAITHQPLQTLDNTKVNAPLTRAHHFRISAMPNGDVSKEEEACHPSPAASISPERKGNAVQQPRSSLSTLDCDIGTTTLGPPPILSKSLFLLRRALNIVQHNYFGRKHSSQHVLKHIHKPVLS